MDEVKINPDDFKPWQQVCSPDPRSGYTGALVDLPNDLSAAIASHHAQLDGIRLNSSVPGDIRVQFDTAKNLCLYAWFVYRFYPVAEHQALTCLEFALRNRFPERLPKEYWNRYPKREPTLDPLLRYAIDTGVLKNSGFRRWHERARQSARARCELEQLKAVGDSELDEIWFDPDEAIANAQDYGWDLLSVMKESLREIRNAHAHGTTMLHNWAYSTLELVAESINQLFPEVVSAP